MENQYNQVIPLISGSDFLPLVSTSDFTDLLIALKWKISTSDFTDLLIALRWNQYLVITPEMEISTIR